MRVLIAPDKFRGTLTAVEAARAMAAGVGRALPDAEVVCRPVADGGEGFLDAAAAATGAEIRRVAVRDAMDGHRTARIGIAGADAYVESADGIGIAHRDPTPEVAARADSGAVGELLLAALDAGADRLTVGIGGTATTDAGAGMLTALGARLLDRDGRPLPPGGAHLVGLSRIHLTLDERLVDCEVVCAHDVDSPLLGPQGAAAVFGPQKGADPPTVARLQAGLARLTEVVREQHGIDLAAVRGGGAGGGLGAAFGAVLGAQMRRGADLVLDLVGLDDAIAAADLVLTGEGSFDAQSLDGKGPWAVVTRARAAGVPVVVVAGRRTFDDAAGRGLGLAALAALADDDADPFRDTAVKLTALVARTLATIR